MLRKSLSKVKRYLITLGGLRGRFELRILDTLLHVDYNLRGTKPDRDYRIILELARGKRCVLDVGANHGVVAMLIASQSTTTKVHAFEASEDAVNVINYNLLLNSLDTRVRVVNSLIADESGKVIPFYWEHSSGGASITKGRLGHNIEIYKATLSLDDYVFREGISPDFIKMDIEGAENLAIRGMDHIMKQHRPTIFIELHEFGSIKLYENAQAILDHASQFNYLMVYLRNGQPIVDAKILQDRGRCHVLLVPAELHHETYVSKLDLNGL